MSIWKDIKKDDIDISDDKQEIYILYKADYNGDYYITLKVKDILEILKENNIL